MTDLAPSPVDSWREALVRWNADSFATIALPAMSDRSKVLNELVDNYTFNLMCKALEGVRVESSPQDISATALIGIHHSTQIAMSRLANQVPATILSDILKRANTLWEKARDVSHKTLTAPRLHHSNVMDKKTTNEVIPLPGFEAAWPPKLPLNISSILSPAPVPSSDPALSSEMGPRLESRREAQEQKGPTSRPGFRA